MFVDSNNVKLPGHINKSDSIRASHAHPEKKGLMTCNITPFVLMIALAMHATFEGIALGLMSDWP